jgi:hypothetical protein
VNLGEDLDEESDVIEDPSELLDKRVDFLIVIESLKLPDNFKNAYVEYDIIDSKKEE